jgi:biotin transport system substrate-specific component
MKSSSAFTIRGIVFSALFAALLVGSSYLNVSLGAVPFSLENLVVMLAGALLGAWYGFFSMLLVVVLTSIGLPLLHGSGGMDLIMGPTGGYIISYPFAALLVGLVVSRLKKQGVFQLLMIFVASEVFGSLFVYMLGVPWLMHAVKLSFAKAMVEGCYPFLIGDAIKAVVAAIVVYPIRQLYPASRLVGKQGSNVVSL